MNSARTESADISNIVDAVNDLTRVVLALQGKFESRSEAVRRLHEMGIPSTRIGGILGMRTQDVSSVIAKAGRVKRPESPSSSNGAGMHTAPALP